MLITDGMASVPPQPITVPPRAGEESAARTPAPEHTSPRGDFPAHTPYRAKRGFVTSTLFPIKLFREDLFLNDDLLELEFLKMISSLRLSQGHLSF